MALIIRQDNPGSPIRPDRVYATGVISPMSGFYPPSSAQRVLQAFTSGALGSPTLMGPLARLGYRVRAFFAARRARAFSNLSGGNVEALHAQRVAPQIAQQVRVLDRIASGPAGSSSAMVARSNIFGRRY